MKRFTYKGKPARREAIKRYYEIIENLPVVLDDGTEFQCDDKSISRMQGYVDFWTPKQKQPHVEWKLADNRKKSMTRTDLEISLLEVRRKKAIRNFLAFEEYEAFLNNPETTINDLEQWLGGYRDQQTQV